MKLKRKSVPLHISTEGEEAYGEQPDIVVSKKKKKKAVADDEPAREDPLKRVNLKKKEHAERVQRKKNEKVSKKRTKELAKIAERRKKKQSRESLIESLNEVQLNLSQLEKLTSTAKMQGKETREKESAAVMPQKLSCMPRGIRQDRVIPKQKNYCETDSSSGEDEEEAEPVEPITEEVETLQKDAATSDVEPAYGDQLKLPAAQVKAHKAIPTAQAMTRVTDTKAKLYWERLELIKGQHIAPNRTEQIEEQRRKLPVYSEEQMIVESINYNTVVIIHGETGSGKTTQIPQFLYESGYTSKGHLVGITEPRRVAAISMSQRVGQELGDPKLSSYQIRFEGNRTDDTKVLFMTDGVLLKELQTDVILSKYSVIVIDEAHERSMYSDVLIGLLSRICLIRAKKGIPLKLVIMSATLRLADFTQKKLFNPDTVSPKVISVQARQYDVKVHFERETPKDYFERGFKRVCQIHDKLPDGAILVFLSGQREVQRLCQLLKARYPMKGGKRSKKSKEHAPALEQDFDPDEMGVEDMALQDDEDADPTIDMPFDAGVATKKALFCLPLYSLLPSEKQQRVFQPIPEGTRLCVVATNVAETSLTIPNIRYVIDSGKEKRRMYDPITGVSQFKIMSISKASADQRSGRAGRVQDGHVYRLYSSAVYEDFEEFAPPEITNKPVEQLVLRLQALNIVNVINFPFPTAPRADQIKSAEERLWRLGALTRNGESKPYRITPLGRSLLAFPVMPEFAKILVMANQHALLPYAALLVSALSVREPMISVTDRRMFGNDSIETQERMADLLKRRRAWCQLGQGRRFGDLNVLLRALIAANLDHTTQRELEELGLHYKQAMEIRKMRRQLITLINSSAAVKEKLDVSSEIKAPSDDQVRLLRQIFVACLQDRIAKRVDSTATENVPKGAYQTQKLEEYVFIDSTSVFYKDEPEWVLYQEIVEVHNKKKCMQQVMIVESEWLPKLAESSCTFTEVKDKPPTYDEASGEVVRPMQVTFSSARHWSVGEYQRTVPETIERYRYFAQFLLEGRVFPKLAEFSQCMLYPAATLTKHYAKQQRHCEALLNALVEKEVNNREKLKTVWKNTPEFLLEQYCQWIPEYLRDRVRLQWPPL